MNSILKADPAISITGPIGTRKQLQFDAVITTQVCHDILLYQVFPR